MPLDSSNSTRSTFADRGERFVVNPTYQSLLIENGLTSPEAFVALEGAIVSGHPDRHVMHIAVGKVSCYLKREHRVPLDDRLNNFIAGHGLASVSIREAQTLAALARLGISVPEWLAAGETRDGRAFLLIRDVGISSDLRAALSKYSNGAWRDRSRLAERLAQQIAEIHNRGFTYPDLCAKHILVDASRREFTFLDWQRASRRRLTWRHRCRDLALLDASLADDLADRNLRSKFLVVYWHATSDRSMSFGEVTKRIRTRSRRLSKRSSIREQRLPKKRESQPLFWLDGERFCATELGRKMLDVNRCMRLAYPNHLDAQSNLIKSRMNIDGKNVAALTVRRTVRRIARTRDWLCGRQASAPECLEAAQMLREERLGGRVRLLAFGQRTAGWGVVDSFILALADSAKEGRQDDQCLLAGLLAGDAKLASG